MNFNRYITEAEFSELAAFIRREGVVRRFARGERLSGQGLRSHRCGLVVQGAFRYAPDDRKAALARRILARAREMGVDVRSRVIRGWAGEA